MPKVSVNATGRVYLTGVPVDVPSEVWDSGDDAIADHIRGYVEEEFGWLERQHATDCVVESDDVDWDEPKTVVRATAE